MLEAELFALFEHTADAMYAVTDTGEVCAWNHAAQSLFGYTAEEVLHRNIDELFEARDVLGTEALSGGRRGTAPTRMSSSLPAGVRRM